MMLPVSNPSNKSVTLYPADAGLATPCEIVFPNPHNLPAKFTQLLVYAVVASLVRGEFLFPECTVAGGNSTMLGAAVPETAVNKNRQSCRAENEVRFSEYGLPAPPAGDSVLAK